MPYFSGRLEEFNGEQEYGYDYIIKAKNLKEAEGILRNYAKTFYNDDDVEQIDDDIFDFFDGAIRVQVGCVSPTTKQQWLKDKFQSWLIAKRK